MNASANPWVYKWRINGVPQPDVSAAFAAADLDWTWLGSWHSGDRYTTDYDDIAISSTAADYPLGPGKSVLLKVDSAGTPALISGATSNSLAAFTSNATVATTFNATNVRNALTELPPTYGGSASGVAQRTSGAGNAVELPLETYTLQTGEAVNGGRMLVAGWANSATSGSNLGVRAYNGTDAEAVLSAGGTTNVGFTNDTNSGWICKMLPASWSWTQAKINALVARLGYSTDIAPVPGAHWAGVELDISTVWPVGVSDTAAISASDTPVIDAAFSVADTGTPASTDGASVDTGGTPGTITARGFSSATTGAGTDTSLVCTVPAATLTGDQMFATLYFRAQETVTDPSGWVRVNPTGSDGSGQVDDSGMRSILYKRTATGTDETDTTSYTWSWTTSCKAVVLMGAYGNPHATTPIRASAGISEPGASTTTHSTDSITAAADDWVISIFGSTSSQTWTMGDTERLDVSSSGTGPISAALYDTNAGVSAGSVSKTATQGGSSSAGAFYIIALQPAPSAGDTPKSVSDTLTVSSSDVASLLAAFTVTDDDTVAGAETLSATAAIPIADSDTVAGAETLSSTVAIPIADSDTVAATEAITPAVAIPLADSSTVASSDAASIGSQISRTDSGAVASTDANAISAAIPVSDPDTVAGTEVLATLVNTPVADTGAAASSDAITSGTGVNVADSDVVASNDAPSLTAALTVADSAAIASSDARVISVLVSLPDTASLASGDSPTTSAAISVVDSDSLSVTEALSSGTSILVSDSDSIGVGETVANSVQLTVSDLGLLGGNASLQIAAAIVQSDTDTIAALESLAAGVPIVIADASTIASSEGMQISATLSLSDTLQLASAEQRSIAAILSQADLGTVLSSDSVSIAGHVQIADASQLLSSDTPLPSVQGQNVNVTDTAQVSSADTLSLAVQVVLAQLGNISSIETPAINGSLFVVDADLLQALESVTVLDPASTVGLAPMALVRLPGAVVVTVPERECMVVIWAHRRSILPPGS
jgi:hypothetical protein